MKGKGLQRRTKAELIERVRELERENALLIGRSAKPKVPPGYVDRESLYDGSDGSGPNCRHRDSMG